jgi:hypothetical protein
MNKSITVAVVSVSIMVIARIIMGGLALLSGQVSPLSILLPIVFALLILIGIIKGQRLAWQWGRLLGLLGAFVLTFAAVGTSFHIPEEPALVIVTALVAMQGVPLFPMFFALGTAGAKEHFRLICPGCGKSKVKAGNFLFTKVICRQCNTAWS